MLFVKWRSLRARVLPREILIRKPTGVGVQRPHAIGGSVNGLLLTDNIYLKIEVFSIVAR
jgi:hypothetical protein